MTSNFEIVNSALGEIYAAYGREITRWYRIRRQAIKRGRFELAHQILEEIHRAESERSNSNFWHFEFNNYEYLFVMDDPDRRSAEHLDLRFHADDGE